MSLTGGGVGDDVGEETHESVVGGDAPSLLLLHRL